MAGLSRPTVHRQLKVLIEENAIEQDPVTRRYLIGTELGLLGMARTGSFPIRAIAEPFLQALANDVGDTVFLSVRHGTDSVCIGRYLGTYPIQVLSISIGARRPLGASVSGLVLLAGMPPSEAKALTQINQRRLAAADREASEVLRAVTVARGNGYVYAPQGVMPGTSALALPLQDHKRNTLAAVSITGLQERLSQKRLAPVLASATAMAHRISQRYAEVVQRPGRT
jgi:DNA-binding IclR family transcriptional regulator